MMLSSEFGLGFPGSTSNLRFCIIIVKNINNLMLELGPLAVKAFFLDLKKDLLTSMRSRDSHKGGGGALGFKSEEAMKMIDSFCQGQGSIFKTSNVEPSAAFTSSKTS